MRHGEKGSKSKCFLNTKFDYLCDCTQNGSKEQLPLSLRSAYPNFPWLPPRNFSWCGNLDLTIEWVCPIASSNIQWHASGCMKFYSKCSWHEFLLFPLQTKFFRTTTAADRIKTARRQTPSFWFPSLPSIDDWFLPTTNCKWRRGMLLIKSAGGRERAVKRLWHDRANQTFLFGNIKLPHNSALHLLGIP